MKHAHTLPLVAWSTLWLASAVAAAPVDFAQFDASSASKNFVLVKALQPDGAGGHAWQASLSHSRWNEGYASSLGVVRRWPVWQGGSGQQLVAGLGAGVYQLKSGTGVDAKDESRPALRGQVEWNSPLAGGNLFALAQASTFHGSALVAAQYQFAGSRSGVFASSYREQGYRSSSFGFQAPIGDSRVWFFRVGGTYSDQRTRPFIGLTYNGF